jgi:hypothetical protein
MSHYKSSSTDKPKYTLTSLNLENMLSTIVLTAFCAVTLYQLSTYLGRYLRRKLIEKETALADLPFLGEARPKEQKIKGTAVVCGGR